MKLLRSKIKLGAMSVMLAVCMIGSWVADEPSAAEATGEDEQMIYEEHFDSYASRSAMPTANTLPAWWQFSTPSGTSVTLDAYPAGTTNKYLRISDTTTNTGYAQINFPSLESGKAVVLFDIRTEADANPEWKHDYFGATLYSNQNEVITQIQNSTQASGYVFKMLQKNSSGAAVSTPMMPSGSYADSSWYRIKLEVDFTLKKVKGYIYDQTGAQLLGTVDYEGFQIPEATNIAAIKFVTTSAGRGALGIDNVTVLSLPGEGSGEPSVETITVEVNNVLTELHDRPVGVVSNHLFDSDTYHPGRSRSFAQSLQELGAGTVRFGEGEASDRYLWTGGPYPVAAGSTLTPQLSYFNSSLSNFSNSEKALINSDGTYKETQDFNEFMAGANTAGAEPYVIVGLDAMIADNVDWSKSKAELKQAAVEWVRYANITNSWNVKHWEIGNEPFYTSHAGPIWNASEYASVFNEFAAAMKQVDPTIRVGVPVYDSATWNSAVLPVVCANADFVAVHLYGTTNVSPLDTVTNHINQYCSPSDRERITISVTETNTYSAGNPLPNHISRAALLAIKLGKILQHDKVDYMHVWVTRKGLNNNPNDERSAIDEDGNLLPMGKAIQIWNRFLKDQMVATTGAAAISSFSSYSPLSGELSVYFINTSGNEIPVQLDIQNYIADAVNERWVFKGSSSADTSPVYAQTTSVAYSDGEVNFALDPYSVTVIALSPPAP